MIRLVPPHPTTAGGAPSSPWLRELARGKNADGRRLAPPLHTEKPSRDGIGCFCCRGGASLRPLHSRKRNPGQAGMPVRSVHFCSLWRGENPGQAGVPVLLKAALNETGRPHMRGRPDSAFLFSPGVCKAQLEQELLRGQILPSLERELRRQLRDARISRLDSAVAVQGAERRRVQLV